MISLEPARVEQLAIFDEMDQQSHAVRFVFQIGLHEHQRIFANPDVDYLNIVHEAQGFCGYIILANEPSTQSVEFRRILLDQNSLGVGQAAMTAMESYCKQHYRPKRIWLDVYEDNAVGLHIYEKFGYQRFDQKRHDGRWLYFYEKFL